MAKLIYLLPESILVGQPGPLFDESDPRILTGMDKNLQKGTFAGGCFWCLQPLFDKLDGVISTASGYIGGYTEHPTYAEICTGTTGHAEAVEVVYDPFRVTYRRLLEVFWRNIDPTTPDRQFVDVGSQYRTAIFYHNDRQRKIAEASKAALEASGRFTAEIVTQIVPASVFYRAEAYHQDYYKKSPVQYYFYRAGSGRDTYIEKIWGTPAPG